MPGMDAGPLPEREATTVMFTDIVGSTASMAVLGDRGWREVLTSHDELIREQLASFSGTELDTSNDGFLARFERPGDALLCACAISDQVREIGIDVRIGLHADESAPRSGNLEWVFVATGSRVSSLAGAGEVLVSSSMAMMLSELSIQLESRGMHVLEGLPGEHELFEASWHETPRPDMAPFASVATTVSDPRDRPKRSVLALMFTDIVGATPMASRLAPEAWRKIREDHDVLIEREVGRAKGKIVDSAGDQFFATFQLPAEALSCAFAFRDGVRSMGLTVRIGLHFGEVEDMGQKVGGIAIHVGARVLSIARPDEILVSSTMKDLVEGAGLSFEEKGQHDMKGVPGARTVFTVSDS
jgi:class 3 adenylate cyclase